MRILVVGDVVGKPGRKVLRENLQTLRDRARVDLCIANGENAAGGLGITEKTAVQIFDSGVDIITSGNHIWDRKDAIQYIERQPRLLRPINYPEGTPGRGSHLHREQDFPPVVVVNVHGRVFIETEFACPFRAMERILRYYREQVGPVAVIADLHGEATSEKQAFAHYFDGQVAAVVGTHTHVQTADARILPGGTAFITDVGMTGPSDGVIGVEADKVIEKFYTQMPVRFEVAGGATMINAVRIDLETEGDRSLTTDIEPINLHFE